MSDTDLKKTEPNDTSLTLFDGNGFIGINRPSVGIYVQRNRPQKATDSPLSGYEEVIHDLCDHIRILERKAAEAQSLCNRWMKTALDMAPGCTVEMVILPNNPEAFAMSRAPVIHQLERQLSEARAEAEGLRKQRDAYRAVLEGAEYREIDAIGKMPVGEAHYLGLFAKAATLAKMQKLATAEREAAEARQKAIKECVTVLERREAEHLKNYRGGSDVAADYLHEIEQCTEALRALLKEKP